MRMQLIDMTARLTGLNIAFLSVSPLRNHCADLGFALHTDIPAHKHPFAVAAQAASGVAADSLHLHFQSGHLAKPQSARSGTNELLQ